MLAVQQCHLMASITPGMAFFPPELEKMPSNFVFLQVLYGLDGHLDGRRVPSS